jgi:hypothetical protein
MLAPAALLLLLPVAAAVHSCLWHRSEPSLPQVLLLLLSL